MSISVRAGGLVLAAKSALISNLLVASVAHAVLVGTLPMNPNGIGMIGPGIPPATGASVGIAPTNDYPPIVCLGCFPYLPVGITITDQNFDFTRENSPQFDSFVAAIRGSGIITSYVTVYGVNLPFNLTGGLGGDFRTVFDGRYPGNLDLVRLHLDSFSVVQDSNSVEARAYGEWQFFYGPVPEPATAWMLLGGLAVLLARLRGVVRHTHQGAPPWFVVSLPPSSARWR